MKCTQVECTSLVRLFRSTSRAALLPFVAASLWAAMPSTHVMRCIQRQATKMSLLSWHTGLLYFPTSVSSWRKQTHDGSKPNTHANLRVFGQHIELFCCAKLFCFPLLPILPCPCLLHWSGSTHLTNHVTPCTHVMKRCDVWHVMCHVTNDLTPCPHVHMSTGCHFRKLKGHSSNVSFATFQWKETFELWVLSFESAFENVTPSGIGCTCLYLKHMFVTNVPTIFATNRFLFR